MEKFNLERALNGDKVVQGDSEASQFKVFSVESGILPLVCIISGRFHHCRLDGTTTGDTPLTMAPKKLSGFVNIYADGIGSARYATNALARKWADESGLELIACIDLSQFEEGHGL